MAEQYRGFLHAACLGLAGAAVAVSGCAGGEGGGSPASTETFVRAALIRRDVLAADGGAGPVPPVPVSAVPARAQAAPVRIVPEASAPPAAAASAQPGGAAVPGVGR